MNETLHIVPQGRDAAFPKAEFDRRIAAVRSILAERGLDLLLTTAPENIFYLTGQQTPGYYMFQCLGVPAEGEPFLLMRGLETYNARYNSHLDDILGYGDGEDPATALADLLRGRGWSGQRVAIDREAWFLTVNTYERIAGAVADLEDGAGLVEALRRVKSPLELEAIRRASEANGAGMRAGLAAVRAGASENDVAAAILDASVRAGGEYVAIEPFVASGPRSGIPHATWRRRTIAPGDLVILETAACYNRYHSALFRTVTVGDVPEEARDCHAVCVEALAAAIETMKPGRTCADVHNAVQAVIDGHGRTEMFRKKSGYSMGISFAPDWGEHAVLALHHTIPVPLEPDMVFHIPITLRSYARFTVAASETVVVTEAGARPLNDLSQELVEV